MANKVKGKVSRMCVSESHIACQLILLPLLGFAVAALFPLTPNSAGGSGT